MIKKNAILTLPNGKIIELPVIKGSTGPDVLDITSLYQQSSMFTFDPGFTSTGSCKSSITFIDGNKGTLLHRGYRIEDLAENSTFLETAYLLMYGDLPNNIQKKKFLESIAQTSPLAVGTGWLSKRQLTRCVVRLPASEPSTQCSGSTPFTCGRG